MRNRKAILGGKNCSPEGVDPGAVRPDLRILAY
jgi:hypothetical protein